LTDGKSTDNSWSEVETHEKHVGAGHSEWFRTIPHTANAKNIEIDQKKKEGRIRDT